jgi:CRP-like cAMP-binding protein
MGVTTELLKRFPILKLLPDESLETLAECSVIRKFARRAVVLAAGKKEDSLCFLFEGRLQGVDFTIDGREVGLYFVESGGFCGELTLFDNEVQAEHVIALTPVVTIAIPTVTIRTVMRENAEMLDFLGVKLTSRIREMAYQRSLLGLPNIEQRVCCQLWSLITPRNKDIMESSEIFDPPTHMEIAIMLNVSRETVSRVFQSLQSQGIVRRAGTARLDVIKLKLLKELAEGSHKM